jgi:hypothetical protein
MGYWCFRDFDAYRETFEDFFSRIILVAEALLALSR